MEVRLLSGSHSEIAAMQSVCVRSSAYIAELFGSPMRGDEAHTIFHSSPSGGKFRTDVFGIYLDREMIGFAHIARSYPRWTNAKISLMLVQESHRDMKYGTAAWARIESDISRWPPISTLSLAVLPSEPRAMRFWQRQGFRDAARTIPHPRRDGSVLHCGVLEKEVNQTGTDWLAPQRAWMLSMKPRHPWC